MVMAGQFESFLEPFIIIFTIPLAVIGVVLALLVTGTTLSVMSLVGVLMLAGIVVNNGIVMVDYANQLRGEGRELEEAIVEASTIRMRPILMTAFTTILAMFPLALEIGEGSESWSPMAISVIGGLFVATMLTLLVEPCIYVVFGRYKAFRRNRNGDSSSD
jgi:HAE1 family hydrophobic/amphiphilic exporter-1